MDLVSMLREESPELYEDFVTIMKGCSDYLEENDPLVSLYYHASNHSKNIIALLEQMLAPIRDTELFLNKHELFIILVVAYMHDIGIIQINKNLSYGKLEKYEYDLNMRRHAQYIYDKIMKVNPHLTEQYEISLPEIKEEYREIVAEVAKGHSREYFTDVIEGFEESITIDNSPVRAKLITALFIIADKLDLRYNRVNFENVDKYILSPFSQLLWYRLHLVDKISIEDGKIKTVLSCHPDDRGRRELIASFFSRKIEGLLSLVSTCIAEETSGKLKFELEKRDIIVCKTGIKRPLPDGVLRILEEDSDRVIDRDENSAEDHSGNFYISKVILENIRCFKSLKIDFEEKNDNWSLFLGDNCTGKTTILRSIAMGVCDESSANGLFKGVEGDFIRNGCEKGRIEIILKQKNRDMLYSIKSEITKSAENSPEVLRQTTDPEGSSFPWNKIFICGYGCQRLTPNTQVLGEYLSYSSVKTLFNYQASLLNTETVLRRNEREIKSIEQLVSRILMLDENEFHFQLTTKGLSVALPNGIFPIGALGDGYASYIRWVVDFFGWSMAHGERGEKVSGILLIDELDQHLHPRWQRCITDILKNQFPDVQFIVSTHTPLIAAGISDIENSRIFALKDNDEDGVKMKLMDNELLNGKRADQILTSDVFGLNTSKSSKNETNISKYLELLLKKDTSNLNEEETITYQDLLEKIKDGNTFGENDFEIAIEKAVHEVLMKDELFIGKYSGKVDDAVTKAEIRIQLNETSS